MRSNIVLRTTQGVASRVLRTSEGRIAMVSPGGGFMRVRAATAVTSLASRPMMRTLVSSVTTSCARRNDDASSSTALATKRQQRSSYNGGSSKRASSSSRRGYRRLLVAGFTGVATLLVASRIALADDMKELKADGDLFATVGPKLDAVLAKMNRHDKLPKRNWLWGDDQRTNLTDIDHLLDEVISMLNISDLNQPRDNIRKLETELARAQRHVAELREQRISAPVSKTMGMDSLPGFRTKEGYDALIKAELDNVADYKKQVKSVKTDFRTKARTIGLEMTDDSLDALLESVSGDDLINMGVVFKNVKTVTTQLEKLTNQSGEHLDMAQRYYGMYVVLLKTLDHMQRQFVRAVDSEFAPKLKTFIKEADGNIQEANTAIAGGRGDANTLRSNIESNKLTQQVAEAYVAYLGEQKQMIIDKNRQLVDSLVTANNTYKTVTVSRNVAGFLQKGNENFNALMSLQMPELRAFENEKLRTEFQGLTQRMKGAAVKK